ncbi:MAG: ATP-binding protein [Pseudomonadota bacterium]
MGNKFAPPISNDHSLPIVDGVDDPERWRKCLFNVICIATAAVHLIAPFLFLAIAGYMAKVSGILLAIGITVGVLPLIKTVSIKTRSWILFAVLLCTVISVLVTRGFGPSFGSGYPLVLVVAGLLLGRAAMISMVVITTVGFLVAGYATDIGLLAISTPDHDPSVMRNWLSATVLFSAICLTFVIVVRYVTREVNNRYASAHRELAQAKLLREAAMQARTTRLGVERELRRTQIIQAVGQLSGGLAHLFNNALTVVRSALETVQVDASVENRQRAKEQVQDAFDGTLKATSDLMIFSRRDEPDARLINLADVLREFSSTHAHVVPNDVDLRFHSVEQLNVLIDPKSFQQMLLNLVLNAAEAISQSGQIRITAALYHDKNESTITRTVLAIEDNGRGMSPDSLARAIDPFYSRDSARSGLGLSVAHAIAEQAGGELRLESDEEYGTRALVILPLVSPIVFAEVDPNSIWPTSHVLHRHELGPHQTSVTPDINWSGDTPDTPQWQHEVVVKLARVTTGVVATILTAVALLLPQMIPVFLITGGPAVILTSLSGWKKDLSPRVSFILLIVALSWVGVTIVFATSYTLVSAMIAVATAVIWAALLGKRWDGLIALIGVTGALLLAGYLRSGPFYLPPLANGDVSLAANWYRFAPQVALFGLILSRSVVGVLTHTANSVLAEKDALKRVESMRLREAEEGARLLKMESQRNRSERSEVAGQAAGTVIHDLRNAIHAVVMASDLLSADDLSDEQIADAVLTLADAVDYAEALATQFDGVGPGVGNDGRYPIYDLSANVDVATTLLRRMLPESITLEATIQPDVAVRIGSMALRRLLFNLVTNARDAIDDDGTISLSLTKSGNTAVLNVTDTGCGITDAKRDRIFEPFYTTKKGGMGTGLGLHLVADIINDSNGTLDVQSQVGVGSSFTITWPAEKASAKTPQRLSQVSTVKSTGTVLLAEDEINVRAVMAQAIRNCGYDVTEAADGDEGKQLAIENTDFVAACIDGVMPGAPSSEIIDEFLKHHPGRPVLLCSGYMSSDLANRDLVRPGVTYVAKPFSPSRLVEALASAIHSTQGMPKQTQDA